MLAFRAQPALGSLPPLPSSEGLSALPRHAGVLEAPLTSSLLLHAHCL